ncbi:MAG: type III-B CRISPR module-associated Cmr3 family protein [Gallionella sp.]
MMKRLKFSAFDTLFFREARPMESVGAKPLVGRFPPTARTVSGAVRSVIGEAMQVDWQAYRDGKATQQAVRDIIGAADVDGIGKLELRGAFPMLGDERLYPAPLHLLGTENHYVRLQCGTAVTCDLGKVYLPEKPSSAAKNEKLQGAKPLENCWLTSADLVRVLSGDEPEKVIQQKDLFKAEARLGIALDSGTRSAAEGKLYQTVHARLKDDVSIVVSIGVDVTGIPADLAIEQVLRLGGEGRFAHVQTSAATALPVAKPSTKGLLLMLCTAADFAGNWLPQGFKDQPDEQGVTVWHGEIAGVALTIQCAVLGKAQREGGWDMQKHQSRAAVSLIPAGSVYFCKVDGDLAQAAEKLHGKKIGNDTTLGRGELAVGYW